MKKLITFLFVLTLIFPLVSSLNYKVNLNYSEKNLSISFIEIDYFSEQSQNFGNYSLVQKDFEGNILHKSFFDFNPTVTMEYLDEETGQFIGEEVELQNFEFDLILPYFENATSIELYNSNLEKISEKPLTNYASDLPRDYYFELDKEKSPRNKGPQKEKEDLDKDKTLEKEDLSFYYWISGIVILSLIFYLVYDLFIRKQKIQQSLKTKQI